VRRNSSRIRVCPVSDTPWHSPGQISSLMSKNSFHLADAYAYRLFRLYDEAGTISVTVLPTILRLSERGELPLCRSQLPRLLACAISLNAKYWDDGAANETVYLRMCELAGISPDVFATMEMEMLSRLVSSPRLQFALNQERGGTRVCTRPNPKL
jgi:hypothetical protein